MSHTKSSVIKSLVVIVAVALIATSMISGGATASEAFKPAAVAPAPAPPPVQFSDSQPNHTVSVKRLKESTPEGNALLILSFNDEDKLGKLLRINLDNRTVVFRDDGTGGDEVAGDRRMSARVNLDFAALTANQNRIRTLSSRSNAGLTVPVFDGRVIVGERQMSLPLSESELQPDQEVILEPNASSAAIDPERSLIIRDPRVVEDPRRTYNPCTGVGTPMGKWTFGYLMQEMANQPMTGINPSTFARLWLKHWENNLVINGWGIAARQAVKDAVITPWEQASGGPGFPLDLSKAPFKLIAIVNRIDLRGNSGYTTNNAGEARFVFGVIDRRLNRDGCCTVNEMSVILEYGIDVRDCNGLKSWANQWVNLSTLVLGSATYNAALEAITEQFAKAGVAPHKVNGSALNQLRTNEFLPPITAPWEMREFRLTMTREDPFPPTGQLIQTTVKQTPDESLNNTGVLANFINANCAPIQTGTHIVPLDFPGPGNSFLGGNSFVPPFFWNAPGLVCDPPGPPGNTRFQFSFNTCSGCHGAETATAFYHIRPTPFGTPATLSLFLSGPLTVNDPTNGFSRTFNEIQQRALNLDMLANIDCNVFTMDLNNKIIISGEEGQLTTGRSSFVH
ncbi:MAG TPA: hypothetical protein VE262_13905 [Blastocatellia bacterium]|nr:hypothetical protein [Blastocatellia bacterium]